MIASVASQPRPRFSPSKASSIQRPTSDITASPSTTYHLPPCLLGNIKTPLAWLDKLALVTLGMRTMIDSPTSNTLPEANTQAAPAPQDLKESIQDLLKTVIQSHLTPPDVTEEPRYGGATRFEVELEVSHSSLSSR
jgi:hypothetical protein